MSPPTPTPHSLKRPWIALLYFLDQRWVHFVLIACLMTGASLLPHRAGWRWWQYIDHLVLDRSFTMRVPPSAEQVAELPQTRDIIMVQTSHSIPRPILVQLLRKLRLAKVVAFDMMFLDREADLDADPQGERMWYRDHIKEWRAEDRLLAREFQAAGNVILGAWPEERRFGASAAVTGQQVLPPDWKKPELMWDRPPSLLWRSARQLAHFRVEPDEQDGVVRRVPLFAETPQKTPCLGLAIAAAASGMSPQQLHALAVRDGFLQFGSRRIPVQDGSLLIDYVGGRECFDSDTNRVMYHLVLDETYPPEDFAGKIVIVGESSMKSKEILATPFGEMPGMQVHANVAATLLSPQGPPVSLPLWQTAFVALACCLLLAVPLQRLPLLACLCVAALEIVLVVLGGMWIFTSAHKILPASVPIIAIGLTYNAVALYEYRRARETLGRFIGREMVPQTLSIFSRLRLGGHVEEASAFFCDLRGYSNLTEHLAPEVVTRLVNEYTTALVQVVKRHQGRPIDYQGDGVFVLFEQSLAGRDFTHKAVSAALELQGVFQRLRQEWAEASAPLPEIGIGIETGPMMIGLVGAHEHMKLGAVGDAVNIAARVQGLNLECGYNVLVTSHTYERIKDTVPAHYCGIHSIKGRAQPLEVYGLGAPIAGANEMPHDGLASDAGQWEYVDLKHVPQTDVQAGKQKVTAA